MQNEMIRELVRSKIQEKGYTYKEVSRLLGRNHAYIQQYIERGSPARLPEGIRGKLAELLGVSPVELGAPESSFHNSILQQDENIVNIPEYSSLSYQNFLEGKISTWQFPKPYIEAIGLHKEHTYIAEMTDSAMYPTLTKGEKLMVDQSDVDTRSPGIFNFTDGEAVYIRRIEHIPADKEHIMIICDSDKYENWKINKDKIEVLGRVVWAARKII